MVGALYAGGRWQQEHPGGGGLLGSAGPQTSCCLPEPQCPPLQRGDVVETLGWVHAQPLPRASVPLQGFSRTIMLSSQGSEAGKT